MERTIEQRAIEWALSDDTGTSSKALCAHMIGIAHGRNMPPSDASDRGRCIRLLRLIPEWIPRLDELAQESPIESLECSSSGMHRAMNSWSEQIPLIRKEGGF